MTPEEFRHFLQWKVKEYGSQKAFARFCGINEAFLSEILRGKKDPGPKLLMVLGFRRVVTYEKIREET